MSAEFCPCLRGRHPDNDGFTLDPESGLWVHVECRLPTEAYAKARELSDLL